MFVAYRTIFLLGLIVLITQANAQPIQDFPKPITLKDFGLRGPVSKVEEVQSFYRTKEQKLIIRNLSFDKFGRLDSITVVDTNSVPTLTVYHYSNDTLISSEVIYKGKKSGDSIAYLYNKSGRLREIHSFNLKGKPTAISRYRYDSERKLNYIMKHDGDNKLMEIIRFRFPAPNEYVRSVFDENQQYVSGIHFMIETGADKTQWTRFYYLGSPDSLNQIEDITLNAEGLETRKVLMDGQRRMTGYSSTSYNEHNDPIESSVFSELTESQDELRYEYNYDAQGNWTSLNILKNDSLEMSAARAIIYFKDE